MLEMGGVVARRSHERRIGVRQEGTAGLAQESSIAHDDRGWTVSGHGRQWLIGQFQPHSALRLPGKLRGLVIRRLSASAFTDTLLMHARPEPRCKGGQVAQTRAPIH